MPENDRRWWIGWVRCTICGHRHVSVEPVDMVCNGECPNCGHMTCEHEEEDDAKG